MGVRRGYKQTEVGVIPEDWEVVRIGDLQPFVTSGSRGWARHYSEIGSPFIRITNLSRKNIYLNLTEMRFVDLPESNSEMRRTELQDGDLLISITADIGIVGYVTAKVSKPAYINQHIALIRFDSVKVYAKFVCYFLSSAISQKLFRFLTDAGAKLGMNLTTVMRIPVAIPPTKAEQQAIAEALSDADALIESLEQLLTKKRLLKQGAMQELLTGKRRLPGFEVKRGYKQTEVGVIPEDWGVKTLDDIFNFSGGLSASRAQLGDNGICYLHYGDIHTSSKSYLDVEHQQTELPKLDVNLGDVSQKSILADGDVVFVDASEDDEGTSKHQVIRNPRNIPLVSGLHTIVAKSKANDLSNNYKCHCFQTRSIKSQFRYYSVGTKVSGISKMNIGKIMLPLPPLAEQDVIATILSDIDLEIHSIETKLTKTRQLKQGMMQELLTGRIRL